MLICELVTVSTALAATRSRKAKTAALAALLAGVDVEAADELETVVSYAGGALRQRRTGLGWRALQTLPDPAAEESLEVVEVHRALDRIAALAGPGSQAGRSAAVADLFGRATAAEQGWLVSLITGQVRQGALESVLQEALAAAAGIPLKAVRRAAMLAGSTTAVARAAMTGGEAALADIGLAVGRPVSPMLAASAGTVAAAIDKIRGADTPDTAVAVDTKLDGIRVQVHRDGDDVVVATRSLDEVTARLPEVVELVRALPVRQVVLDGEVLLVGHDGRPRPFQQTASRTATRDQAPPAVPEPSTAQSGDSSASVLTVYFFDVIHLDGRDLIDVPAAERTAVLEAVVPPAHRVPRLVTADADAAERFARDAVAAGHEGVVVKSLTAPYDAGRRGSGWIKVKPVHTLDLVVVAVEWGSGRRRGKLSNIHLAARDDSRDPADPAHLVMLGKTFKGMTDEMLAWQTERFLALETHRVGHVVHVRPEQVVEVAIDGVQRSTRYPGGVALRFARVLAYRQDKPAHEADTLAEVRRLL